MKIGILGNGSIGLFCAAVLSELGNLNISLIGPNTYDDNASLAAGAMHASTAEVETPLVQNSEDLLIYKACLKSRNLMNAHIKANCPESFTAKGTIVFLNSDSNSFERKNYNFVKGAAERFDRFENVNSEEFFHNDKIRKKEDVIYLNDEFGFDPRILLNNLNSKLSKKIDIINDEVVSINVKNNSIITKSKKRLSFDRLIIANGAGESKFIGISNPIVPTFHGLGTALLIKENETVYSSIKKGIVYRSVNRGGSQCGFHYVPCSNNYFYIGAGNRLSLERSKDIRFETIKYLLNETGLDLFGKKSDYLFEGKILLGSRSRSVDFFPLFGRLMENGNIFIAKGFNRVGLTLSPFLAQEIKNYIKNPDFVGEFESHFKPQRYLISHGNPSEVADSFAEMTCANLVEHNMLKEKSDKYKDKKKELAIKGLEHIKNIQDLYNLPKDYGPAPDSLSFLANANLRR